MDERITADVGTICDRPDHRVTNPYRADLSFNDINNNNYYYCLLNILSLKKKKKINEYILLGIVMDR